MLHNRVIFYNVPILLLCNLFKALALTWCIFQVEKIEKKQQQMPRRCRTRPSYRNWRIQNALQKYANQHPSTLLSKRRGTRIIHQLLSNFASDTVLQMICAEPELLLLRTTHGKNGFHLLCCNSNAATLLQQFCSARADFLPLVLNSECNKGLTPFMYAMRFHGMFILKLLISHGAQVEYVSWRTNLTAYHMACHNSNFLQLVSEHAKPELALIPSVKTRYLNAPMYAACVTSSKDCLQYFVQNLKLPITCTHRWASFTNLVSNRQYDTMEFLVERKIPVPGALIYALVVENACISLVEPLLRNSPSVELDAWIMYYCKVPCFALICSHVKRDVLESWYTYFLKQNAIPLEAVKQYIQHSAPASVISQDYGLPIKSIICRERSMCAFDEASLKNRLARITPPISWKSVQYFNGKQWSSDFTNWNAIPNEITLVECKLFRFIPIAWSDISISTHLSK